MHPHSLDDLYDLLRWQPGRRPRIAAHRGAPEAAEAENCLATFERAVSRGATFIEIDVRKTLDGEYVLHHDDKLGRTCTGQGRVAEHTLADLRRYTLRDLAGKDTGQRIPTLAETIEWARAKALLYVDVKPPTTYREVQLELKKHNAEPMCVTLTFDIRDTLEVHRTSPGAMIYAMVPEERRVRELLACGIPHRQLIGSIQEHTPRDMYDLLHEHGISVDYPGWAGTDRRAATAGYEVYLPAIDLGSDIFNTDDPKRVNQAIDASIAGRNSRAG